MRVRALQARPAALSSGHDSAQAKLPPAPKPALLAAALAKKTVRREKKGEAGDVRKHSNSLLRSISGLVWENRESCHLEPLQGHSPAPWGPSPCTAMLSWCTDCSPTLVPLPPPPVTFLQEAKARAATQGRSRETKANNGWDSWSPSFLPGCTRSALLQEMPEHH